RKVTDTYNEVGSDDLFRQILAAGIIELIRAVYGNRIAKAEYLLDEETDRCCLLPEMHMQVMVADALHPAAYHQGFRKINPVHKYAPNIELAQMENQCPP